MSNQFSHVTPYLSKYPEEGALPTPVGSADQDVDPWGHLKGHLLDQNIGVGGH